MKRQTRPLRIELDVSLVEVSRSRGHLLRLSYVRAVSGEGKALEWYALTELYQSPDRTWRPTKKRFTLRRDELGAVGAAMISASRHAA
jgi:hypothetical protein